MTTYIKDCSKYYLCSDSNTEFNQIVISFAYGLLFGSLSWGLLWLIIFFIFYELFFYYVSEGIDPYWRWLGRLGIIASAFLGWIIGRWLVLGYTGCEFMMRE